MQGSVAEPEPPLFEWLQSRSRIFCWSEPRAGADFLRRLPDPGKYGTVVVKKTKKSYLNFDFILIFFEVGEGGRGRGGGGGEHG